MAIKANGLVIITDDRSLTSIQGYDQDVVNRMVLAIRSENHSFTVYNSAGTAIKTVAFAAPTS